MMHRGCIALVEVGAVAWLLAVPAVAAPPGDTLVPKGSVWRYLDDGSDAGTAWRQPAFDDTSWEAGPAKLGYGDSDVVTEVGYGPFSFFKYVTTWFRHTFQVANAGAWDGLILRLRRDDGAVVYLNGVEVARSHMPPGAVDAGTLASANVSGADEDVFQSYALSAQLLVTGSNVLAVEIHQSSPLSSDIGLDVELLGVSAVSLTRGPYLQLGTPTGVHVRWRTDVPTDSMVWFGDAPDVLDQVVVDDTLVTEHDVVVAGLVPDTKYYYAIGHDSQALAGADASHFFATAPPPGAERPLRVWILGDSGTADASAAAVRDAYEAFTGSTHTDLWLMLGDNAYGDGTDAQYQAAVFDMYPQMLRKSVLWPTRGNHDGDATYFDMFTLPTAGEAGGMATGTESYYSFDFGNAHFVCLNSFEGTDVSVGGAMWTWLGADLASTDQEWIIAYWHHPPYSKGSHDSDTILRLVQMRMNFLPLLEVGGVDLVLAGHSHGYERSYLVDGHYGFSFQLSEAMVLDDGDGSPAGDGAYQKKAAPHGGAVYAVAGCSGKTSGGTFDHPVMFTYRQGVLGSVVLDIDGPRLDMRFVDSAAQVQDAFTLRHVQSVCQRDLGFGGPGAVTLGICGDYLTQANSSATLSLAGAAPGQPVFLFVGTQANPTPIAGGTLVPYPWLVVQGAFSTDAAGGFALPVAGDDGPVATLILQAVVPNGPVFEFSNAVRLRMGF